MSKPDFTGIINTLTAERNRAIGEQRSIVDSCVAGKREQSGEERAIIERTDAAIDKIDAEVAEWRARIEREKTADQALEGLESVLKPEQRAEAARNDRNTDEYIEQFLRGEIRGDAYDGKKPGIEVDLVPAIRAMNLARQNAGRSEYRDLSIVTAAAGGTLVPTSFSTQLLIAMETIGGPLEAGCEVLNTTAGESMVLFTEATAGTAAIVGEGSALAEADATYGRITLGAYKYAQLVQVTQELVTDAGIDIVADVARSTGKALARVTNTAFTTGSGSNAPQGYVVGGGNGGTAQTTSTGVPSYANLVDLLYNVSDVGYTGANSVWMTLFANIKDLRKIKDTAGVYIWEPSLAAGQPSTLLGYRLIANPAARAWATAAGTGSISFGDFNEGYVVRRVNGVRFERSDDFAFGSDLVSFRSVMRVDAKVKQAGAIRVMREPTT